MLNLHLQTKKSWEITNEDIEKPTKFCSLYLQNTNFISFFNVKPRHFVFPIWLTNDIHFLYSLSFSPLFLYNDEKFLILIYSGGVDKWKKTEKIVPRFFLSKKLINTFFYTYDVHTISFWTFSYGHLKLV